MSDAIQWAANNKNVPVSQYIASLKPYTPPYHLKPYNKPDLKPQYAKYNA